MLRSFMRCGVQRPLFPFAMLLAGAMGLGGLPGVGIVAAWGQAAERNPLPNQPKTPEERMKAALLLVDLARLDLAKETLKQLVDDSPDDETLLALRAQFGTATFLKFSRNEGLKPESTTLLQMLTDASRRQAANPEFAESLLSRLTNDATRGDATRELKTAGPATVGHIVRRAADGDMERHSASLVFALSQLDGSAIPPLIAGMDAPEPQSRVVAMESLGWLQAKEAVVRLWAPAFGPGKSNTERITARHALARILYRDDRRVDRLSTVEANHQLSQAVRRSLMGDSGLPIGPDGNVAFWEWDADQNTAVKREMTNAQAAVRVAERYARDWLALTPESREAQQHAIVAKLSLETALLADQSPGEIPWGPTSDVALELGATHCVTALSTALDLRNNAAAVALLRVLELNGSAKLLYVGPGTRSPAAALSSPDPRVQFAAANTVMTWNPDRPYSGGSRVIEILARSLDSSTRAEAVVIHGSEDLGNVTASHLSRVGYEPRWFPTGREGFDFAATHAGVELIVLHTNVMRWNLSQTMANLRADPRTAAIPVILYGPAKMEYVSDWNLGELWKVRKDPEMGLILQKPNVDRLRRRHPPAFFVEESPTDVDFLVQAEPFLKEVRATALTDEERALYRKVAIGWLAQAAERSRPGLYDFSRLAGRATKLVPDPELAPQALSVLASIPSSSVQQTLFVEAQSLALPKATRLAAADRCVIHVQRFGVLLPSQEIAMLVEARNRETDLQIRGGLTAMLGALGGDPASAGRRLLNVPRPRFQ